MEIGKKHRYTKEKPTDGQLKKQDKAGAFEQKVTPWFFKR